MLFFIYLCATKMEKMQAFIDFIFMRYGAKRG